MVAKYSVYRVHNLVMFLFYIMISVTILKAHGIHDNMYMRIK